MIARRGSFTLPLRAPPRQGYRMWNFYIVGDRIVPALCVAFQHVVPANAGTHTARTHVSALWQRPFFTFEARGDGSRSLPSGRQ